MQLLYVSYTSIKLFLYKVMNTEGLLSCTMSVQSAKVTVENPKGQVVQFFNRRNGDVIYTIKQRRERPLKNTFQSKCRTIVSRDKHLDDKTTF